MSEPSGTEVPVSEDLEDGDAAAGMKHVSDAEKEELCANWELGTITLADACAKYGMKPDTMRKWFSRRGAKGGSRKAEMREVAEKAIKSGAAKTIRGETAKSFATQRLQRIEETREDTYKWATAVQRMALGVAAEAQKSKTPMASVARDMQSIQRLMNVVERGFEVRAKVLDMLNSVDEDDLPELIIRDISKEEIEEIKNAADEDELDALEGLELPELDDEAVVTEELVGDD